VPGYINPPPLPTDTDELQQGAFDVIREYFPSYDPHEGQLATIVLVALSLRASQQNDLAQMIPRAIFRWYGVNVVNLPPLAGVASRASFNLTVTSDAGYMIPVGTLFLLTDTSTEEEYLYALEADLVIQAGQTSGTATVRAEDTGAASNNITGGIVTPVEALDYLLEVTHVGTTAGGQDEEDDDDYLNRLTRRTTLPVRPVWASDFSNLTLVQFPNVYRALFVDNFIPPASFNEERAVAGLLLDADGNDLQPLMGLEVEAYLQTQREWGFVVNIMSAVYTVVDGTFTFKAATGYDAADVKARAEAAFRSYVNPGTWGAPAFDAQGFERRTTVDLWEMVTILNNVSGLDKLVSLTLGKNGGVKAAADLTLDGAVPLPRPGTIVGTPI
jgi:hypothetical protein